MDKLKEQCNSYIKFLLYHFVIMFTVVAALLSATEKIEGDKVQELVRQVIALKDTTGKIPYTDDYIINGRYFEDEQNSEKVEQIEPDEFIEPPDDSTNRDTVAIVTEVKSQDPVKRQKDLVREIENEVKAPFQFTLSFLGNVTIDMRYWMFFMPLLFIVSLVYIFILDYKISIEKELLGHDKIPMREQYPFRFMRLLLLAAEGILFLLYLFLVFQFFKFTAENLRNLVYKLFILTTYYSLLYCFYVKYTLQFEAIGGRIQNNQLNRYFHRIYSYLLKTTQRIFLLTPKVRFSISQVFLLTTLFLVMSYSGCNEREQNPEDFIKGFELFTLERQWESRLNPFMGFVLKYSYNLILILSTVVTAIILFRKRNAAGGAGFIKTTYFLSIFFFILFTVYFSNFNIISAWADFVVALLLYGHWYYMTGTKRNVNTSINNIQYKSYYLLVLYLLPFLPFLMFNIIDVFELRNGWGPFYIGLWIYSFNLFGEYLTLSKRVE